METADQLLARVDPTGQTAAAWLRAVITGAGLDLEERVRPGWQALAYHHPEAGYVVGVFPRRRHAQLVIEHGAALSGFGDLFDQVGAQIGKVIVQAVPDPRADRIVDAILAEIALRSAP